MARGTGGNVSKPKPRREDGAAMFPFPSFGYLRPSAEESHDTCAEDDASCSIDNLSERSFIHFLVEEELVRKKLNETSVEQDAGAERVEDAAYN